VLCLAVHVSFSRALFVSAYRLAYWQWAVRGVLATANGITSACLLAVHTYSAANALVVIAIDNKRI